MSKYRKVSDKLIDSLKSYGVNLDKPATTNAIIFAIAEAYGMGEDDGIILGKKKAIEEIDRLKNQIIREVELDEALLNKEMEK